MALSSMDELGELLLPILLLRFLMFRNGEEPGGEPASPRPASEVLLRCWAFAWAAAVAMRPEPELELPLLLGGERPKSSDRVCPDAKDERRWVGEAGGELSDVIVRA